jgi:hypothetical protein
MALSVLIRVFAVVLWAWVLVIGVPMGVHPLWLIALPVAVLDRLDATRHLPAARWQDRLLAVLLIPSELYCLVREAWMLRSAYVVLRNKRVSW